MSKTFRQSPEDLEFGSGQKARRITRHDIETLNRIMERAILTDLPPIPEPPIEERPRQSRPVLLVPRNWIIPTVEIRTDRGELIRESRLDLLQTLGEQILEGSAES